MGKRYVILLGDLYWRPNSQGYTRFLLEAGVYSEEEARSIEAMRPPQDKAVPLATAVAAQRVNPEVLEMYALIFARKLSPSPSLGDWPRDDLGEEVSDV